MTHGRGPEAPDKAGNDEGRRDVTQGRTPHVGDNSSDSLPSAVVASDRSTITRDSAFRLGSVGLASAFMLAASIIVARSLGADGKGVVATVGYLVALTGGIGTLGLGDAAIVLTRQRRIDLNDVAGMSVAIACVSSVSCGLLLGAALLLLPSASGLVPSPVVAALAGVGAPLVCAVRLLSSVGDAKGRLVFTSGVYALTSGVTAVVTSLFVLRFRWGVVGAVGASCIGAAVGMAVLTVALRRDGVRFRVRKGMAHAAAALRLGLPMEFSQLLRALAARVDVVIVYAVAGVSMAGYYSVALTISEAVRYAPSALTFASFPALAAMSEEKVSVFVERASRLSLGMVLACGLAVAVPAPWLLPVVFGPGFDPAVGPTLVLIGASVPASLQWTLSRAAAARGVGRVLVRSFSVSLLALVAGVLLLAPAGGALGAAAACLVSSLAGAVVAFAGAVRALELRRGVRRYLPGPADFQEMYRLGRGLFLRG